MARKRRKRKTRGKNQLKSELIGLLLIFLAIFGSGASAISDGLIPNGLENIFRFLFGIWYFVASIFLLILGVYLLLKRTFPDFFTKKKIGFFILFLGLLLLTHIQTFERLLISSADTSIIKSTWHHYISYVRGEGIAGQTGGGMIGGLLFATCYYLFSSVGAKIVAVFSMLIGLIFMTELSLGRAFTYITNSVKKSFSKITSLIKKKHKENKEAKIEESTPKVIDENELTPRKEEDFNEVVDVQYSYEEQEQGQLAMKIAPEEDLTKEESDPEPIHSSVMTATETDNDNYLLPSFSLLNEPISSGQQKDKMQIQKTARTLEETFKSFGVRARVTKVHVGPAVTRYEIYPDAGVKVSRIVNLHDDLALALAAQDIRIEAPIPGKSAVGIEVPNSDVAMVSLREVLDGSQHQSHKLLFALGRDISGEAVLGELNKMPHLLIAGATGSGKSVCINGIITSILMRAKPNEVKMMMIDPKKVELNVYNGIPHLLAPVVTDPNKASMALKKVVAEMERRYKLFSETSTRNIEGYNDYIKRQGELTDEEEAELPYIVVLVDELADLMMVASNDVEDSITRLAQMARAAGIHLIIATQRPSVDVITGVIKANIPSRIAFSVSSQVDSRTILDMGGAEKLLGRGDMLYIPVGKSKPIRVQGAFLSDEEVERVVEHCTSQQKVSYQEEMIPEDKPSNTIDVDDELFDDAVQLIVDMQSASVSMLQRRFRIGYTRAARLIDAMEDKGIVGPYEGNRPRAVLIEKQDEENSS